MTATGWSLERAANLRRDARWGRISQEDTREFVSVTDEQSLDCLRFWSDKTFCRAHYVGMWPLIAATTSCKLRDRTGWRNALRAWEQEHGLAWNDFGIVHREARILTSH